jgi:hypothetical protein
MDKAHPKELVGNVDSIWNQEPRKGMQLHWDGNSTSVDERNLSVAFGTGAYPPTLDTKRVLGTAKWLETAAPPALSLFQGWRIGVAGRAHLPGVFCRLPRHEESSVPHHPSGKDERVGTVVPL